MNTQVSLELRFFYFTIIWTFLVVFLSLYTFTSISTISIPSKDKYAHFIFYFILGLGWMLSFKNTNNAFLLKIGLSVVFFGILIEVLQELLTVNREADVYDVFANSAGVCLAYIALPFVKRKIK
jgi:VanZ family protein